MDLVEQNLRHQKYKTIITKGWSGMLFLLLVMLITDIIECGMKNDFQFLQKDPSVKGLWILVFIIIVNVLTQIAIHTFENRLFRWLVFGLTVLYTLFFFGHQVIHLISGEGIDLHFFIDITHHVLGIWAIVYAHKWAKNN